MYIFKVDLLVFLHLFIANRKFNVFHAMYSIIGLSYLASKFIVNAFGYNKHSFIYVDYSHFSGQIKTKKRKNINRENLKITF